MAVIKVEVKDDVILKATQDRFPGKIVSVDEAIELYIGVLTKYIQDDAENTVRRDLQNNIDMEVANIMETWKIDKKLEM